MNKSLGHFQHAWLPYAFLAPQLLITVVFFIWPSWQAIMQSMFAGDPFGIYQYFVGFDNFLELLNDPAYRKAMWVTMVFSVSVSVLCLVFGLLTAFMVHKLLHGKGLYKTLFILPYAVAPAVAGILWRFLFNPAVGVFSHALQSVGIDWNYMLHAEQAMTVVVLAAFWQHSSYNFLFFLAGLQAIPQSIVEAAAIDGASSWQRLRHIIFPLLSPTTFFLLIMNMIYCFFETFGIIQVMTRGGPFESTNILVYKVYNDGFIGLDLGSSAAQSVLLMLMVIILTGIQFKYIEKKVHYR